MASKVFLHIGLPKTATTYLQTIFWGNRETLEAQGVLMPGQERADHLWASRIVREDPQFRKANAHRQGAWQRILDDTAAWEGRAVVSQPPCGEPLNTAPAGTGTPPPWTPRARC